MSDKEALRTYLENAQNDWCRYMEGDYMRIKTWSAMRLVADTVRQYPRVSVRACHGISKTFLSAALAIAFLNLYKPAVVITTAPTMTQVRNLLWKEIGAIYQQHGAMLMGEADVLQVRIDPEWYMVGFSTDKPTRMEGYHAPNILWILDEAKGLEDWLYKAIEGSMTGGNSHVLEVSTTDGAEQQCPFRTHHERGKGWKTIHLSALDSPFVDAEAFPEYSEYRNTDLFDYGKPRTGTEWPVELSASIQLATSEWIQDRLDDWEETDPMMVETKVWGEFSMLGVSSCISLKWIESAVGAEIRKKDVPVRFGLDVARYGGDRSVLTPYHGGYVSEQLVWPMQDTMVTVGKTMNAVENEEVVQVDSIGLGAPVFDRLVELGQSSIGVNSSARSYEPDRFYNFRAELWWNARDLFQRQYEEGGVVSIPDDPELVEELAAMQYKIHSDGRIIMEDKKEAKKRIGRSPDKADSFVYSAFDFSGLIADDQYYSEEEVEEGVIA